jgi:hypothetical protein
MNLKEHMIPVIGFVLIAIAQVVYQFIGEQSNTSEIVTIIGISVLLYSLLVSIYEKFFFKTYKDKEEYDAFLTKIEASVNKLIQKQRFIDQATLDIIEKQADDIWVVTTSLSSELKYESLQKSVEDNLKSGKTYTYFLPHESTSLSQDVDFRLESFKKLPLYNKYKTKITFVRLPRETLFLLEEVVIYNPTKQESKESDTKGLNAFTFYESKNEDEDSLHMKIDGNMLEYLRKQLNKYASELSLKHIAEKILEDHGKQLGDKSKLYITDLMMEVKINDQKKYSDFISDLIDNHISDNAILSIKDMLKNYIR